MVAPSAGSVVLVPFPFSDLSRTKLRPALVLAAAGGEDWILCQITSNAYADPSALPVTQADFQTGSLRAASYARPGKLFTASRTLIVSEVGKLKGASVDRVLEGVVRILRTGRSTPPAPARP